jgi:hypothetical protein
MVMMETDDKLIREFMHSGKAEIADNGFTRRVMHRLPQRSSVVPLVLGVAAFVLLGFVLVWTGVVQDVILLTRDIVVDGLKEGTLFDSLRSLFILLVGLGFIAYQKLSSAS